MTEKEYLVKLVDFLRKIDSEFKYRSIPRGVIDNLAYPNNIGWFLDHAIMLSGYVGQQSEPKKPVVVKGKKASPYMYSGNFDPQPSAIDVIKNDAFFVQFAGGYVDEVKKNHTKPQIQFNAELPGNPIDEEVDGPNF